MSKKIFVRPANQGGSVEHYFHFMFGYFIPFLENIPPKDGNVYLFRNCGPMSRIISEGVPGYDLRIAFDDKIDGSVCFSGHDDTAFLGLDFSFARETLMRAFGVEEQGRIERVLVVDRAEPDQFYELHAEIRGSGSSRRSVPNMAQIVDEISRSFPTDLVYLEDMSIRDQVDLFSKYRCFVLQHGASMANLLFARKGSALLEIRDDFTEDYFAKMKLFLNLRYGRIRQENCHSEVNPKEVVAQIARLMRPPISLL